MPRVTLKQRADKFEITVDVLNNAKNQGVNVWNDDEMNEFLKGRRPRLKPDAKLSKKSAKKPKPGEDDLEHLRSALMKADTIEDVRILKEKAAGVKLALAAAKEAGESISLKEAKEAVIKIVAGLKARLLKLPSDTAPRVEGLGAAQAETAIREEINKALEELADDASGLFKD